MNVNTATKEYFLSIDYVYETALLRKRQRKNDCALGLALRAAGSGMNVHIVQFLKGSETGELHALERLEI